MKNKIVGTLIIIIATLIGFMVFMFNRALTKIVSTTCTHGSACPMWGTISFQTNVSLGIMVFIIVIGLYLIFFGREEKIITKIEMVKPQVEIRDIKKENYEDVLKTLGDDERSIFEKIIEEKGTIFQSTLVEKTGLNKVKITRILDILEGKGLVERKRRGMTNVVVLKHN